MGRLMAEGIARARALTRDEIVRGLERVKSLPSATGRADTLMGFGRYDRGALKGQFLVIREWHDGDRRVEWRTPLTAERTRGVDGSTWRRGGEDHG